MNSRYPIFSLILLLLAACDVPEPAKGRAITTQSGEQINRYHPPDLVAQGGEIFQQYCAPCHGKNGEGNPEWRKRGADGLFPPPPLNGTGHAWHHPMAFLQNRIKNGSAASGGNMPAWGSKLNEKEIDAVIAWFQSQWPDQLYAAWYEIDQRALRR